MYKLLFFVSIQDVGLFLAILQYLQLSVEQQSVHAGLIMQCIDAQKVISSWTIE